LSSNHHEQGTESKAVWFWVPQDFNASAQLPANLKRYAHCANYLLHSIATQQVQRKTKDGFIPLRTKLLRQVIPWRVEKPLREWLIEQGIIEIDRRFTLNRQSMRYRFGPGYAGQLRAVRCTDSRIINRLDQRADATQTEVHRHLLKQLGRIRIDRRKAGRLVRRIRGKTDNQNGTTAGRTKAAIETISRQSWYLVPDSYGRCHTPITNLPSVLRAALRVDNQPLMQLDIANAQPLLLGWLVKHKEYLTGETEPLNRAKDRPIQSRVVSLMSQITTNQYLYNSPPLPNVAPCSDPVLTHCCSLSPLKPDEQRFISVVQSGQFYEYLFKHYPRAGRLDRDKLKARCFETIFHGRRQKALRGLARIFAEQFPNVWSLVLETKKDDYKALAGMLMRIESSIIIDRICQRFMAEQPEMFVATIHDSLLVKPSDVAYARGIMAQEFQTIGLLPTIRVEPC
jgi:hypothetical protein